MTIKMLDSCDAWRGTNMGDGTKEDLTSNLQMAIWCHCQYCEDFVPEGILRETAIKTAEFTLLFWNALVAYIKEKYTLLLSFKLLPKHVFLLCCPIRLFRFVTTCSSLGTKQRTSISRAPCQPPPDLHGLHCNLWVPWKAISRTSCACTRQSTACSFVF
jgi:hypothetical protein